MKTFLKTLAFLFPISDVASDVAIFKVLGRKSYIRNGVGFGFISEPYLYDNCFVEIGIGRVTSGWGDWGSESTHTTTSPLKITVDKNCVIQKVETDSFYNSDSSQEVEKEAKKLMSNLKIGTVFVIKDEVFKEHVYGILNFIPCKSHIGHDVFDFPHMLKICTDPKEKDYYHRFRDPANMPKEDIVEG